MIELWMVYVIIAIVAILVEIFAPSLFCINFAVGGIITSIVSIFWGNFYTTMILFVCVSLLSLIFLKPVLQKILKRDAKIDFDSQYIGKVVKCIEPISNSAGAVTIYEERWEARLKDETAEEIQVGTDVKVISNDSLILFVEKIIGRSIL